MQRKCRPKNVVFSDILFIAIFAEVTENECVTENRGQLNCRNNIYLLSVTSIRREPRFRIGNFGTKNPH